MKILVIDVGGTHIKVLATGQERPRKAESGPTTTAQQMVDAALLMSESWRYDVVSIGFPGAVREDLPVAEPHNLGPGWVDFDFASAFGRPVKMINVAAMQSLGSYQVGRMLFLGLGTGLGSALIVDGMVAPLELAHLPYKKGKTYEDYVGLRGLQHLGKKKWRHAVADVCERLKAALQADDLVLGGGNAERLKELPAGGRRGDNANAFIGGYRLWDARGDAVEAKSGSARAWRRTPEAAGAEVAEKLPGPKVPGRKKVEEETVAPRSRRARPRA